MNDIRRVPIKVDDQFLLDAVFNLVKQGKIPTIRDLLRAGVGQSTGGLFPRLERLVREGLLIKVGDEKNSGRYFPPRQITALSHVAGVTEVCWCFTNAKVPEKPDAPAKHGRKRVRENDRGDRRKGAQLPVASKQERVPNDL